MSQNEINNMEHPEGIDELLNSFLDGELDARQQTEVQRLLKHDKQIAERLKSLRNCKQIVSSLPYAEAPDGMLENIKASLVGEKPIVQPTRGMQQRLGVRHLFARRFVAAAAMIGLVAVFAAVIYSIVIPEVTFTTTDIPVAVEMEHPEGTEPQPRVVAAVVKPVQFIARLELKTGNRPEVAAFINKAIEFDVPSGRRIAAGPDILKKSHVLSCSRESLKLLMYDLGTIWDKIDSATLFVPDGTSRREGQITIDAVAPEQLIEIAKQDDSQKQIETARFFAAMNKATELTPGKEVQVAIDDIAPRLLTIPKPVLTSNEKPVTKTADQSEQMVFLTIVVTGSK
ncbi:MAG: hypothetical protein JW947_09545 [Sedimentisphaerales bacterium]|nr:hypothetical protein [Sedimentisphaerales bacterium]